MRFAFIISVLLWAMPMTYAQTNAYYYWPEGVQHYTADQQQVSVYQFEGRSGLKKRKDSALVEVWYYANDTTFSFEWDRDKFFTSQSIAGPYGEIFSRKKEQRGLLVNTTSIFSFYNSDGLISERQHQIHRPYPHEKQFVTEFTQYHYSRGRLDSVTHKSHLADTFSIYKTFYYNENGQVYRRNEYASFRFLKNYIIYRYDGSQISSSLGYRQLRNPENDFDKVDSITYSIVDSVGQLILDVVSFEMDTVHFRWRSVSQSEGLYRTEKIFSSVGKNPLQLIEIKKSDAYGRIKEYKYLARGEIRIETSEITNYNDAGLPIETRFFEKRKLVKILRFHYSKVKPLKP
ncbi:MAG: hypothetical protein ACFB10_19055 [Salibacteraceae bacterium]